MAMIETPRSLPLGALAAHRVGSSVSALAARFVRWREVRRTVRLLSELDAHQLDDLGLTRGDIAAFARRGRF